MTADMGYQVKRGDTLSAIARQHGVTVAELVKANPRIKSPDHIETGWVLKLPTPSGKALPGGQDGYRAPHPRDTPTRPMLPPVDPPEVQVPPFELGALPAPKLDLPAPELPEPPAEPEVPAPANGSNGANGTPAANAVPTPVAATLAPLGKGPKLPRPEAVMSSTMSSVIQSSAEERARMLKSMLSVASNWDHSPTTEEMQ